MKIVISPNSFKEWKASKEIAEIIRDAIIEYCSAKKLQQPQFDIVPIGDGGQGTIDAIFDAGMVGKYIPIDAIDPLGRDVIGEYLSIIQDEKIAFIEMAKVSGLHLIEPELRNPLLTTSYGVGQLIKDAFERGHKRMIIGVGGAGSHDGGVGMAQALGIRFFDIGGNELPTYMNNEAIEKIEKWDLGKLVERIVTQTEIKVASDVNNPLLGGEGASYVFGKQKGATDAQIGTLEKNLGKLADIAERYLTTRDLSSYHDKLMAHFGTDYGGRNFRDIVGTGAAGGLSYGLLVFLGAYIEKGVNLVSDLVQLKKHIEDADMVITGEGKLDYTTFRGKVVMRVGELARKVKVEQGRSLPVLVICGCEGDYDAKEAKIYHLDGAYPASDRQIGIEEIRTNGDIYLKNAAIKAFGDFVKKKPFSDLR